MWPFTYCAFVFITESRNLQIWSVGPWKLYAGPLYNLQPYDPVAAVSAAWFKNVPNFWLFIFKFIFWLKLYIFRVKYYADVVVKSSHCLYSYYFIIQNSCSLLSVRKIYSVMHLSFRNVLHNNIQLLLSSLEIQKNSKLNTNSKKKNS